jgi:excisionase family DNA binding protein
MTPQEVADLTGLSVHTLYKMVSQRRIPYVKVGRLLRFDSRLIDEFSVLHCFMFRRIDRDNLREVCPVYEVPNIWLWLYNTNLYVTGLQVVDTREAIH